MSQRSWQETSPIAGRRVDHGPYRPVTALIEEQADAAPHRPAVTVTRRDRSGTTLTYAEFDGLANGLADGLARAGVGRGDMLPLLLGNSLELPLCMVAAMKLGAVFVVCDPAWPEERLRTVLRTLAPPLVLTAGAPVPAGHPRYPVAAAEITPRTERPFPPAGPGQPAYGVFTSGSTGVPKCAVNLHGGLANRFRFMSRYFRADGEEVVLQNSRHTFDSAIWQLLWPLTTGGRTLVPEQGDFLDLEQTVEVIGRHRVTLTDFVPAVLATLVSLLDSGAADPASLVSLRHLVVGGEEIIPRAVHRLRDLLPGLSVTNGYGPSEASIGMLFHRVTGAEGDHIPLGLPIDNCYAVIAAADAEAADGLRPLSAGRTGEILIGGACLGAGYLGDPARTDEVFVPNPFPEIPGRRLYRTGDLGWFDEEGRLRFAGRRDRQAKVDGVRIEPGEIETAAESCPGVVQAKAFTLRREGRTRLVVAAASDTGTSPEALRSHLAARLPRVQLPHRCIVLQSLPLTPNGKTDLHALRALAEQKLDQQKQPEPAGSGSGSGSGADEMQLRLARLMGKALGLPGFRVDDDFLAHGGDSLTALRIVLALRKSLGVRISVPELYALRTPAALAAGRAGRPAPPGPAGEPAEPAEPAERDSALPSDLAEQARAAQDRPPAVPPRTVLVTGANGFIGARVVHLLLCAASVRVVCLVRAGDDRRARERLVRGLRAQGLWRDTMSARLDVRHGDLAAPRFGWPREQWERYAARCDAVLHAGARVSFVLDYRAHRPANVLGTAEVLRFALSDRPKAVHHVSTLGVLDGHARGVPGRLGEDFDPGRATPPAGGYSRSKWVAERLVRAAGRLGAPVAVYRLGEVMPAADNGLPNPRALTHLLLSAFRRLGVRPDVPMRSDYTPVDDVAARLVAGLDEPPAPGPGSVYHVFRAPSVDFAALDLADRGRPAPHPVPPAQFMARLRDEDAEEWGGEGSAEGALHALLTAFPGAGHTGVPDFRRLLTDNPALFTKDACAALDVRHGIRETEPAASLAAYRGTLGS